MQKKSTEEKSDELRPEYDLGELLKSGVQGKYAKRYQEGANIVLLDGDVAEAFPNDEAVNEALRLIIKLTNMRDQKEKELKTCQLPERNERLSTILCKWRFC